MVRYIRDKNTGNKSVWLVYLPIKVDRDIGQAGRIAYLTPIIASIGNERLEIIDDTPIIFNWMKLAEKFDHLFHNCSDSATYLLRVTGSTL